jgi:UDP-N-acetylmuramoylalanine--D-glutamate ligase
MSKVAGIELKGARVLVAGLAKSGLAAIELLRAHGAMPIGCDSKPPGEMPDVAAQLAAAGVEFRLQSADAARGVPLVIVSPGVPLDIGMLAGARRAGSTVIGDLELASYFLRGRHIGITGTNGKTTTTALAGHLLHHSGIACQVGGNIGTPPCSLAVSSRDGQWNVLELSSFQLESIEHFQAAIAVCLNVTPDHLDRHGTFEAYAACKGKLFQTQGADGAAVLNASDPGCVNYASLTRANITWFSAAQSLESGWWVDHGWVVCQGEPVLRTEDIPLRGRHNWENVLAAAAAARLAGASLAQIAAAVKTFEGVEHRIEFVREVGGVAYYNDSKATNVDAALKAIDSFEDRLWIILGGKDKGSSYAPLAEALRGKTMSALLIGAAAPLIEESLRDAVPVVRCGDLATAVRLAHRQSRPGDVVLLAPACASFDQFDNFEHRGRAFKELVRGLREFRK